MTRPLRVVHLPARTPYVRKIVSERFSIVNGTTTEHGNVPAAVTANWLLDRRPFDWFDVLHLHHIEFDDIATLERLLHAAADAGITIVYTAHDLDPIFGAREDFDTRLSIVAASPARWIGLTQPSIDDLQERHREIEGVTLIPHGYVVPPDDLRDAHRTSPASGPRYLLYGALRPNRDHLSTIANWTLATTDRDARLHLVLRALSPADFSHYDVSSLLAIARSDTRITTTMKAYPTDAEIAEAGLSADALLLPYLSSSHSGQLELAFDLNLTPICSAVGYLRAQFELHKDEVAEPFWFDWADEHPFLFGEKFAAALEAAHRQLAHDAVRHPSRSFLDCRRDEHSHFLRAHAAVYGSD